MSSELGAIDWLGQGWLLALSFTATVLVVVALRKPSRRLFGTERAFQLWLLPPLAMLASQLPHAPDASHTAFSGVVYMIVSAADSLPARGITHMGANWRGVAISIWCAGIAVFLLLAARAQWRYRRRLSGATPVDNVPSRWPVVRATGTDVGPAVVGAWRSRIVLPADFEHRYDATERILIFAHEAAHAKRRDGLWCLLAQLVVAVLWFHPLAWWALSAFRLDQELACDGAVLREYGAHRRRYANAMLKTQSASFVLPVGCTWSPRHPLAERIAMLKLSTPGALRRHAGSLAGLVLATVVGGAAYAAGAPAAQPVVAAAGAHEYQLEMKLELTTGDNRTRHTERMALALCVAPGENGTVTTHGWTVDATPTPEGHDRLRIDLALTNADGVPVAHSRLRGALGESVHAKGKGVDGAHAYAIDIKPVAGCPARTAEAGTAERLHRISKNVKNVPARAVAISVAAIAGLTLVNPELLDERPVTLNFEQIPAERALQLVADIDGRKAVFTGNKVRFEPN